jgi:hypothetical protein
MDKNKPTTEKLEEAEPKVKYSHRYYCDACTGNAGLFSEGDKMPQNVKCLVCGTVQKFKQENLIKL